MFGRERTDLGESGSKFVFKFPAHSACLSTKIFLWLILQEFLQLPQLLLLIASSVMLSELATVTLISCDSMCI